MLAKAAEEVQKVGIVCQEMVTKSEEIFQAYKKALAAIGGEPLPLPPTAEGPEGVLRLYSWLLYEFEGLDEIAQTAGDNAAAVASEGLMAILRRACCTDLERLADRGFEFPSHDELASEIETIQGVKKPFFRRFWLVSGRETVRAIAATQLEAISIFASKELRALRFVIILVTLLLLQEKDVVNAIERRDGDNEPLIGADAAAQGTVAQDEAERSG